MVGWLGSVKLFFADMLVLAEINDNGVFVHPAPMEKPAFWQSRSNSSLASSNYQSIFTDNETFTISRESFDSYRRSFVSFP